jgi:hypothetical protein
MSMEEALGRLVNLMNPYSNPGCEPLDEPRMQFVTRPLPPGTTTAKKGDAKALLAQLVAQLEVEIDNYEAEWTLRGQTYKVTRALRIPYRYEVQNKDGNKNGVWATEWLLIGYGGANGG